MAFTRRNSQEFLGSYGQLLGFPGLGLRCFGISGVEKLLRGDDQGETPWVDSTCADCPGFLVGCCWCPGSRASSASARLCPPSWHLLHASFEQTLGSAAPSSPPPVQKRDEQHKLLQHKGAQTEGRGNCYLMDKRFCGGHLGISATWLQQRHVRPPAPRLPGPSNRVCPRTSAVSCLAAREEQQMGVPLAPSRLHSTPEGRARHLDASRQKN